MPCANNDYCEKLYTDKRYHPKVSELDKKRRKLLESLSLSDLVWTDFPLRDSPKQEWKDAPYRVDVCRVVSKSGLFIPVTADEAFCLARQWSVSPLTSAVMDQIVFGSNYVPAKFAATNSYHNFDFENYSKYLGGTLYTRAACIGAHKVWLISGRGQRINYGFHYKKKGKINPTKYYGNGWSRHQNEGAVHETDKCFWDYSQLIQFMRNLKTRDGKSLNIRNEIEQKNPALWYPASDLSPPPNTPKRFP